MVGRKPRIWVYVAWEIISFSTLLSGFVSGNAVGMVVGAATACVFTSAFLMLYFKSDHRVKRASEVVSGFAGLGIIVYGYVLTGSLILGVITLFIVVMFSVSFILSYRRK